MTKGSRSSPLKARDNDTDGGEGMVVHEQRLQADEQVGLVIPDLMGAGAQAGFPDDAQEEFSQMSNIAQGAHILQNHVSRRAGPWNLDEFGVTGKIMLQRVQAAAETFLRWQENNLAELVSYAKIMQEARHLKAVAFLEYCSYNETKMKTKIRWRGSADSEAEVSNVFVVIRNWAMVFQKMPTTEATHDGDPQQLLASDYFVLRGQFSPFVRAGTTTSGEACLAVLQSCDVVPEEVADIFSICIRQSETDEAGGNTRAEHLLMAHRPDSWILHHSLCMAHKLHSAARKTFQMSKKESDLISAIVHASLQLSEAGAAMKMREACWVIAREELHLSRTPALVDEAGLRLKDEVLALFLPEEPRKRAWISKLASFLNGDWRQKELQHHCDGCCVDLEEASTKLAHMLSKLVTTLRPSVLNKANWMSWSSSLRLFGLGGAMHHVLARIFFKSRSTLALVPDVADPEADPAQIHHDVDPHGLVVYGQVVPPIAYAADDDDLERLRKQRKHSARVAECFFQGNFFNDVFLLRAALHGEVTIMSELLHLCSEASVIQRWAQQQAEGATTFPVLELRRFVATKKMAQEAFKYLQSSLDYLDVVATEAVRSNALRLMARPAAVWFELVELRVLGYPYRSFDLLKADMATAEARNLLDCSQCLLDPLSSMLREQYASLEGLQSQECQQVLHVLASMGQVTTYQGERLHSSNQRRSKRAHVHPMQLHDVALCHMGFAGIPLFAPSPPSKARKPTGRPPKKKRVLQGDDAEGRNTKRRRGGGGAWRFFLSQRLAGQQFSSQRVKELAQEFHSLGPEDKARFKEIGRQGRFQILSLLKGMRCCFDADMCVKKELSDSNQMSSHAIKDPSLFKPCPHSFRVAT